MKLLLASAVSVFAVSCNNQIASLAKACRKDYEEYCSQVDKSNLVSILACAKRNQAELQPTCLAQIQKDFPAVYACTEDLATACPGFGKVSRSKWGNDNDDDDDAGRHRQPPVLPSPPPLARSPQLDPAVPSQSRQPVTEPMDPADQVSSSEGYTDYFTWDYYIPEDTQVTNTGSSFAFDALHNQGKTQDSRQCFLESYSAFSAPCLNAIAEQWATIKVAEGAQGISAPSAEEAYSMMAPPLSTSTQWKKMNRTLFYAALAFFVCTLITCLCCCCRRCRKSHPARVVPGPQDVAPTPGSVMSAPVATPAAGGRSLAPTYIPYTGQGLSAYIPLAQPVQV